MGTNFYTLSGKHLGKRSAAGLYCFDCGITLCRGGNGMVHEGPEDVRHHPNGHIDWDDYHKKSEELWHKKCPKCGQEPQKETLENSSAGRELGFNKSRFRKKKGVRSCSSFTWAAYPHDTERLKFVRDEYGRRYTIKKFRKMLFLECPINYYDMIGEDFS